MARSAWGSKLVDGLAGQAPPAQLAEQHHEQRGGVGGAVVDAAAAERQRRRVAEAHLVQDAAGLLLGAGSTSVALEAGQRLQHAEGQVGVDEQRHPRREQRVAAEQRHEPRAPRRPRPPARGSRGRRCAGRRGPRRCGPPPPRGVVVGLDDRDLAPPPGQPLDRRGPLDGLAAQVAGLDLLVVDDRRDLDARRPLAPAGTITSNVTRLPEMVHGSLNETRVPRLIAPRWYRNCSWPSTGS